MNLIQKTISVSLLLLTTTAFSADINCWGTGQDVKCIRTSTTNSEYYAETQTIHKGEIQNYPEHVIHTNQNRYYPAHMSQHERERYYQKHHHHYYQHPTRYPYEGTRYRYPNSNVNKIKDSHLNGFNNQKCWFENGIKICKHF